LSKLPVEEEKKEMGEKGNRKKGKKQDIGNLKYLLTLFSPSVTALRKRRKVGRERGNLVARIGQNHHREAFASLEPPPPPNTPLNPVRCLRPGLANRAGLFGKR